mmetsp:Transcript_15538/g.48932  ORF Transcript_15538/g.48932 Transcript_15538/m.48932 type:complete len:246 (+) Transcript_15538:182-919(+)
MRILIALLSSGAATALSAMTARPSASARTNLLQVLADVVPSDRFSAPPDGAKRIEEAVAALEKAATDDEKPSFPRDLMVIDGDWDLRFTNNAPPPPPDWVPFDTSGLAGRDVVQKIDVMGRRVKNCVTVAPWPSAVLDGLDGLPLIGAPLAALSKASVALSLDHSFSVDGDGSTPGTRKAAGTNRVNIVFERLDRTLTGLDRDKAPEFAELLPQAVYKSTFTEATSARWRGGVHLSPLDSVSNTG